MLQLQTHSAWSESNTACPRPRGGRRGGENWRLVHLRRWKSESRGPSPNLGCVFVQRRRKRRMARPVGPSRRDHFLRVWSKTPNSSPCRLAIGCFQGNQYVTLLSTVLFLATAFQQTVLPPSRALILCTTDRKSLKMTDFSKTGRENMAETCAIIFFDPGFLFDFYSDRGSTATPFGHSNVSWCGLWAETAWCSFQVFLQLWSLMEQKLEELQFWFLEH